MGLPETTDTSPLPWMTPAEIAGVRHCLLLAGQRPKVLEWGSGGSSLHFSALLPPGSRWEAVEHNEQWSRRVSDWLSASGNRAAGVSHVPVNRPFDERSGCDGDFDTFRDYVLFPLGFNCRFDMVLVDGRARAACMQVGWMLLDEKGVMVLHDAHRPEYEPGLPPDGHCIRLTDDTRLDGSRPVASLFAFKSSGQRDLFEQVLLSDRPSGCRIEKMPSGNGYRSDGHTLETDGFGTTHPRCLFLQTHYDGFMDGLYRRRPGLSEAPYRDQKAALLAGRFGDSDFYSASMRGTGWPADDLVVNCKPAQAAWAKENGCRLEGLGLIVEQVRRVSPEVVYLHDLSLATREFLQALRPHTRLIAGQIASPIPSRAALGDLDVIFSSFPHYVERFRSEGIRSHYMPLAFDPRVLSDLPDTQRSLPVSFVGGVTPHHSGGNAMLELLAWVLPVHIWGYGIDALPESSYIRKRYRGQAWGLEMFAVLKRSGITVNRHIDAAERFANNMRLFEATGCGALLVTDHKDNLDDLFDIGSEVVSYRSPEECVELVSYFMAHPKEARAVARRGRLRTLSDHTYGRRMKATVAILENELKRSGAGAARRPDAPPVSAGYQRISPHEVTTAMKSAWKHPLLPERQRELVRTELQQMAAGNPPAVFKALADLVGAVLEPGYSLLEVGCASGYYSEVLAYLTGTPCRYTGVDFSEDMISLARRSYPKIPFLVADGAHLPFGRGAFDVVVSGCVLLHVPEWRTQVAETVRAANRWVVAHRTPVWRRSATQTFSKRAYGIETVELRFNETELLGAFKRAGAGLVRSTVVHARPAADQYDVSYLFEKAAGR